MIEMTSPEKENQKGMINFRMDWVQEIIGWEEEPDGTRVAKIVLKPDPKKYDEIIKDGEIWGYQDKFTDVIIPLSVIKDGVTNGIIFGKGTPIYYSPPKDPDFCNYLHQIKSQLVENWDKKYDYVAKNRPIDDYLASISGNEAEFVILYVDMAGSTDLSSKVDSATNAKINKIFLMQMVKAIDNANGYLFKYVGDCVIGIFPASENYTSKCDNALQSAMLMCAIIEKVLNPTFEERNIPTIGCHIGLDIGNVLVDKIGENDIGCSDDLIGYHMNVTAKIQSQAGFNEILLGRRLFERLHCFWQEGCEEVDLGKSWKIDDKESEEKYKVYRFLKRLDCPQS